ncbi:Aste57867_525 [Aphanomyces stellatus]|uniref:Aste57867_525 protein n=1 Tax=Aphanomyces stellatus TaxID=120398 RepID=A0A485K616_9STRA|nr:hypothetical protein As57867_000524 [Aphanomyces stellatus]VFT77750.1 Aste57867_525 [Aphanomyces stellatus]
MLVTPDTNLVHGLSAKAARDYFPGYCKSCYEDKTQSLYSNMPGRDSLYRGQEISSSIHSYRAKMQWDSNFVIYGSYSGNANWASGTQGSGATRVVMQGDGNAVMVKDDGTPVWASHTDGRGRGPYCLSARDNLAWGNGLKVYDANCDWFWWSGRSIAGGGNETQIVQGTAKAAATIDRIFERIAQAQDESDIDAIFQEINQDVAIRDIFERIATSAGDFASMDSARSASNAPFSVDDFKARWYLLMGSNTTHDK